MKYVKNSEGEVKVMRKDGTHKFIAEHLANNAQLLKDTDLEIVYEHEFITGDEPVKNYVGEDSVNGDKSDFTPTDLTQESKTKVKQNKK